MPDPYNLARFVEAQETTYSQALAELRAGRKRSHWMWFIFPQIAGLGTSPMSQRYAIHDIAEARAYLAHPVLGPRLLECMHALLQVEGKSAHDILGSPDDHKLHSSATLFHAASQDPVFTQILQKYFTARPDPNTLQRLTSPTDDHRQTQMKGTP